MATKRPPHLSRILRVFLILGMMLNSSAQGHPVQPDEVICGDPQGVHEHLIPDPCHPAYTDWRQILKTGGNKCDRQGWLADRDTQISITPVIDYSRCMVTDLTVSVTYAPCGHEGYDLPYDHAYNCQGLSALEAVITTDDLSVSVDDLGTPPIPKLKGQPICGPFTLKRVAAGSNNIATTMTYKPESPFECPIGALNWVEFTGHIFTEPVMCPDGTGEMGGPKMATLRKRVPVSAPCYPPPPTPTPTPTPSYPPPTPTPTPPPSYPPPTITGYLIPNRVTSGQPVTFTIYPNGTEIYVTWYQLLPIETDNSRRIIPIGGLNGESINVTVPSVTELTDFIISVLITDGLGRTVEGRYTVPAYPNVPPTVEAGDEQIVNLYGQSSITVDLNGQVSDPDNAPSPLRWRWILESAPSDVSVSILDATNLSGSVIVSGSGEGDVVLRLEASDNNFLPGSIVSDLITIQVSNTPPLPPEITTRVVPDFGSTGSLLELLTTISGGSGITILWTQLTGPTVEIINGNSTEASIRVPSVSEIIYAAFKICISWEGGTYEKIHIVEFRPAAGGPASTTINTLIQDSNGNPVPNASVTLCDVVSGRSQCQTVQSNASGRVSIQSASGSSTYTTLTAVAPGIGTAIVPITGTFAGVVTIPPSTTETVSVCEEEIKITDHSVQGGAILTVPANSLVFGDGTPYNGLADITVTSLGGYNPMLVTGAFDDSRNRIGLYTQGAAFMTATTPSGQPLVSAEGLNSTISIRAGEDDPDITASATAWNFGSDDSSQQGLWTTSDVTLEQAPVPNEYREYMAWFNQQVQSGQGFNIDKSIPLPSCVAVYYDLPPGSEPVSVVNNYYGSQAARVHTNRYLQQWPSQVRQGWTVTEYNPNSWVGIEKPMGADGLVSYTMISGTDELPLGRQKPDNMLFVVSSGDRYSRFPEPQSYDRGTCGTEVYVVIAQESASCEIPNQKPVITSIDVSDTSPTIEMASGATITLTLTASVTDPDNGPNPLAYTWRQLSGPSETNILSLGQSAAVQIEAPGTYQFGVTASDGNGVASRKRTVVVSPDMSSNDSPKILALTASPESPVLTAAGFVTATISASIFDDDLPSYPRSERRLTSGWGRDSGPTTIRFDCPTAKSTIARFDAPGTYRLRYTLSDGHLSASETIDITVRPANRPPDLPTVSTPLTFNEGQPVSVIVTGADSDGDALSYNWQLEPTGLSVPFTTVGTDHRELRFTAPFVPRSNGQVDFTVRSNDGALDSPSLSVPIQINNVNNPPRVSIDGPSNSVQEGELVTLTALATDEDGDPLTYNWDSSDVALVGGTISGINGEILTFSAPDVGPGGATFEFDVSVSDGLDSVPARRTVGVGNNNQPPTGLTISGTVSSNEGQNIIWEASASDPDGDTLRYTWSFFSGISVFFTQSGANNEFVSFRAPDVGPSGGSVTLQVVADDQLGGTTPPLTKTLTISNVNQPPTVSLSVNPTTPVNERDGSFIITASKSDPDGNTVTLGSLEQTAGPTASLTSSGIDTWTFQAPEVPGPGNSLLTFRITGSDGFVNSPPATVNVTVRNVNRAPTLTLTASPNPVNENQPFILTATADDQDGQPVTINNISQLTGPSASLTGSNVVGNVRTFSFNAPNVTVNSVLRFSVTGADSEGALSNIATIDVTVQQVNSPPDSLTITGPGSMNEGGEITLTGSATDPDGNTIRFGWAQTGGPSGSLTTSGVNGQTLTFVAPYVTSNQSVIITMTADDQNGGRPTATKTISLSNVNAPPTVSIVGNNSLTTYMPESGVFELNIDATVVDDGVLPVTSQWSVFSGNASFLTIVSPNQADTQVEFYQPGSYVLRLTVTDAEGASTIDYFLTLNPLVTAHTLTATANGQAGSAIIQLSQGQTSVDIPLSASINPAAQVASWNWELVSGVATPTGTSDSPNWSVQLTAGSYSFAVYATLSTGQNLSGTVSVTVNGPGVGPIGTPTPTQPPTTTTTIIQAPTSIQDAAGNFGLTNGMGTMGAPFSVSDGNGDIPANGAPIPDGGIDVEIVFGDGASLLSILGLRRVITLPPLPAQAGTPHLYQHQSGINWTLVPGQNYSKGKIVVHLNHYGSYQVFIPILNLPYAFGEVYVYPNPTRTGQIPTLHIEVGQSDSVTTRVYDVAGDLIYEGSIQDAPIVVNGVPAYEHAFNPEKFKSGVYIGVVTAEKAGKETIRKKFKFTIIR